MWILLWVILSFIVGMFGSNKKIGYWGTFFVSLLLSPLIGLIIALVSADKAPANTKVKEPAWHAAREEARKFEFKEKYPEALDKYQDSLYELLKVEVAPNSKREAKKAELKLQLESKVSEMKEKVGVD